MMNKYGSVPLLTVLIGSCVALGDAGITLGHAGVGNQIRIIQLPSEMYPRTSMIASENSLGRGDVASYSTSLSGQYKNILSRRDTQKLMLDSKNAISDPDASTNKAAAWNIVSHSRNILSRQEAEKLAFGSAHRLSDVETGTVIQHFFGRMLTETEAQKILNEIVSLLGRIDTQKQSHNEELRAKIAARSIVSQYHHRLSRRDAEKLIIGSKDMISDADAQTVIKQYFGRVLSEAEAQSIVDEVMNLLSSIDTQKEISVNEELASKTAAWNIVSTSRSILRLKEAEKLAFSSGHRLSDADTRTVIQHYFGRMLSETEAQKILDEIMKLLGRIDAQKQSPHEKMRAKIAARDIVSQYKNGLSRRDAEKLISDSKNINDADAQRAIKQYFGRMLSDTEAQSIVDEITGSINNIAGSSHDPSNKHLDETKTPELVAV